MNNPPTAISLASAFLNLKTVEQLARLLEVSYQKHLVYYLYRVAEDERYHEFEIKKRNGAGTRPIAAPATNLKFLQQKLNRILQAVYLPKPSVHGFTLHRNISTNAEGHVRKKYVLNVDVEDFFGSINFGRVRGMFIAKPYGLPPAVATVIAQICCHKNVLPQGAPTSPIISNMICSKLDQQLQGLAKQYGCHYSRYADDITFSTNRNTFPADLAFIEIAQEGKGLYAGQKLEDVVLANGFRINAAKTRLNTRAQRQDVTGLVVNQFVNVDRRYVRNLRAALHAWRKYGLDDLQGRYLSHYDGKSRFPDKSIPSIVQVLYGRIQYVGSVRGWDDAIYGRLRNEFNELSPRKIRVPDDPWLTMLQRSCWVIEDEEDILQGTAFFLKGYGLITTDHCIGNKPFIYHPADPSKKYPVKTVRSEAAVDLAILEVSELPPSFHELFPQQFASAPQYGDAVTVVGYPEHAPGKEISIKQGEVQATTMKSGIRRFNVSQVIVAGNSGGPVFNRYKRVIGVAVTGVATLKEAPSATQEQGVIPISALTHILNGG